MKQIRRAKCLMDVYKNVYEKMVQVQLRVPEKLVKDIDRWVKKGRFKNRSDAVKTILIMHQERERTRGFYKVLVERSSEARKRQGLLTP
jgi:Arc/MetJ-type ribon-helix-helix transcriptional regulator